MLDKLQENAATGADLSPGDPVAAWAAQRIAELEAALKWYADPNAYLYTGRNGMFKPPVLNDGGRCAREALQNELV